MRRAAVLAGALLVGALLASGCSHDWSGLEPSQSSAGVGGNASAGVSDSAVASGAGGSASSAMGSMSTADAASSSTSTGTSSSASGGTMPNPTEFKEYNAEVTECAGSNLMNMSLVDPATCRQHAGTAELTIDTDDSGVMASLSAYLCFNLDGALAGKTIDTVTLRLGVTDSLNASSKASGEIWQVESFTEATLAMKLPKRFGMKSISPDVGAVALNAEVNWLLPRNVIAPNKPLFLELAPTSSDGTYYWSNDGPVPPKLIIGYH